MAQRVPAEALLQHAHHWVAQQRQRVVGAGEGVDVVPGGWGSSSKARDVSQLVAATVPVTDCQSALFPGPQCPTAKTQPPLWYCVVMHAFYLPPNQVNGLSSILAQRSTIRHVIRSSTDVPPLPTPWAALLAHHTESSVWSHSTLKRSSPARKCVFRHACAYVTCWPCRCLCFARGCCCCICCCCGCRCSFHLPSCLYLQHHMARTHKRVLFDLNLTGPEYD